MDRKPASWTERAEHDYDSWLNFRRAMAAYADADDAAECRYMPPPDEMPPPAARVECSITTWEFDADGHVARVSGEPGGKIRFGCAGLADGRSTGYVRVRV